MQDFDRKQKVELVHQIENLDSYMYLVTSSGGFKNFCFSTEATTGGKKFIIFKVAVTVIQDYKYKVLF